MSSELTVRQDDSILIEGHTGILTRFSAHIPQPSATAPCGDPSLAPRDGLRVDAVASMRYLDYG